MANRHRSQRDQGQGGFSNSNRHEYKNRFLGMNHQQAESERSDESNLWDKNESRYDREYGGYQKTNSYGKRPPFHMDEDIRGRDQTWYDDRDIRHSPMDIGWRGESMHPGKFNDPYSGAYERTKNWRDVDYQEYPHRGDRSWQDRTRDELSSWFGDDDEQHRRRINELSEGKYKGKGPRNYQRSAERIREDIYDRLTEHGYIDATDIEVEVKNNEVVLSGSVESRQQRRIAEDIVESVSGVRQIENRIRIKEPGWNSPETTKEIIGDLGSHKL